MKEKLNQIALPLMLNNVLALFIGLCDQAMIGHVSLTGFASVGIVAGLLNSVTGILGATSVSFNIIGARAKGKENQPLLESYYQYYMIQSLILGIIAFVLVYCFGARFLKLFYHLEGDVLQEAVSYAMIFSCTIGLNLMIFIGSSYLKIMNQTKYILIGNLTAMIINMIFDYFLIFGSHGFLCLGIIGSAIASVLALLINLLIYAVVIKNIGYKKAKKISKTQIIEGLKLSIPLMGQEFLEETLIVLILGVLIARIGLVEMAVYQLIITLVNIAFMPVYAYGQAALTLISERIEDYSRITYQAIKKSLISYGLVAGSLIASSQFIFNFIVQDTVVIQLARLYFPLVTLITMINIPSTIYKYGLQSIGEEKETFNITCFGYGLGVFVILISFLFEQNLFIIYIGLAVTYIFLFYKFKNIKIE